MILVIDIGTTVLKSAAYDPEGNCLASACREISLAAADNSSYHEVDGRQWITALRGCLGDLRVKNLEAVAVSGNGPTLVAVGPDDMPLDNAMTWLDRRGVYESREISERAGKYIDPMFYLPKAYWIFRNRPEVYEKTVFFSSCPEYITYLLTGNRAVVLPVPEYRPLGFSGRIVGTRENRAAEPDAGIVGHTGVASARCCRPTGSTLKECILRDTWFKLS